MDLYSGIYIREGGVRVIYEQLADEIATVIFNSPEDVAKSLAGATAARSSNTAA